jgi:hypothetical protein
MRPRLLGALQLERDLGLAGLERPVARAQLRGLVLALADLRAQSRSAWSCSV